MYTAALEARRLAHQRQLMRLGAHAQVPGVRRRRPASQLGEHRFGRRNCAPSEELGARRIVALDSDLELAETVLKTASENAVSLYSYEQAALEDKELRAGRIVALQFHSNSVK